METQMFVGKNPAFKKKKIPLHFAHWAKQTQTNISLQNKTKQTNLHILGKVQDLSCGDSKKKIQRGLLISFLHK